MKRAGASVRYYQVDVRDENTFSNLIEEIYRTYGRIDGVVHSAGVIEDKLIEDKTSDSFDRVFDTKVAGAFVLSRKLRPESLQFLAFFSSVAGRFGNRGQCDYAAANETLNKLAVYLDRQWRGRVVSLNWGPWEKAGMVSGEVQQQFIESGVKLISPSAGARIFDEELRFGRKGQVEIILGDGPWKITQAIQSSSSPAETLPLLASIPLRLVRGGSVEFTRMLDPECEQYLRDHQLDGKPVFPMAMAMELIAEVVRQGWPDLQVVGIRSLRVFRGIVLGDGAREVRVTARPQTDPANESLGLEVDTEISEVDQPKRPCYRATVQLAEQFAPPPANRCELYDLHPFSMGVDEAYRYWLFHGPCFQGIAEIEGIHEQGISALLLPSSPAQCLSRNVDGQWLIDPVLLDCGFQLAILWERAHHNMTPLPARFKSYRRFGFPPGTPIRCCLQVHSNAGGHMLLTDMSFVNPAGQVIGLLEGMEFSCNKDLNRLAGFAAHGRGDT
jgi:NAD(P)-dependent dehydrogenase (short-subunit alcohol dehydrogenase family)